MTITTSDLVLEGDIDQDVFAAAKGAENVACDIETSGLNWQSEKIGTVQLAIPGFGNVLVKMAGSAKVPENLVTLLTSSRIQKIFHHAPFDLRFMAHAWAARPANVVCTKVLSRILFPGNESHSLQSLLHNELGIDIQKSAVRTSNWTTSELSAEQVSYALNDVRYLVELYECLMSRAVAEGVATLAEESFSYLPHRVQTDLRGCGDVFAY